MDMNNILQTVRFDIPETIALIGLVQCVYILVYMGFRSGGWRYAAVPFLYFGVLGAAFLSSFAAGFVSASIPHYDSVQWALWFYGPPLGVLLMIQIARIVEPPRLREAWVVLLIPVAFIAALMMQRIAGGVQEDWLILSGLLAGVASMIVMWFERPMLARIKDQPGGRDRYWLVWALVLANLFFLATMLFSLTSVLDMHEAGMIRSIWGLGFIYLAGTSLFRIYPRAVRLIERGNRPSGAAQPVADEDRIVEKIQSLLSVEKVYQEPAYNRVNLAREAGVSESIVSRIVNSRFGKTVPQLLNEHRIADARRLLAETDAPVKVIAEEVGFNSLASFNRVFRELEGTTPGRYREMKVKRTA